MKIREIIEFIERFAPRELQETYDNSGLQVGNSENEVTGILCTIDVTQEVLDEAIEKKTNLIISHHPVIFQAIKSLTGRNASEEIIIRMIKNDIALYSAHTNIDNILQGVNSKICQKIGLTKCRILSPLSDKLIKLVTSVPTDYTERIREVIFQAGAGVIGNYDCCSYNLEGTGTFRGNENTKPFVGDKGEVHFEKESRIETILPEFLKDKVINALIQAHPYEEVAYDLYPLKNTYNQAGSGMIGELEKPIILKELLVSLKINFGSEGIKYTGDLKTNVKKIAVCGGSGSFLISEAINNKADAIITGDIKYHQFLDNHKRLIIIDIGHFESEQFTKDIFYELLKKKISNFAVHLSEVKTNPIKYFS